MVLLASAVPISVGVRSLVMWSPTVPVSAENETIVGLTGAVASIVTAKVPDIGLIARVFPPFVTPAVAAKLWSPSARAGVKKLQAPLPSVVVVPSSVAPSKILIVVLASAVPVSVSALSLVMPSPTVPLSIENEAMVGVVGVGTLIVIGTADDAAPMLPAASVAVAVRLCVPLFNPAVV